MIDLTKFTKLKASDASELANLLDRAIQAYGMVYEIFHTENTHAAEQKLEELPEKFFQIHGIKSTMGHMRKIIDSNLLDMSDIELAASVRFIFEMSLWMRYLSSNEAHGLIFFAHNVEENLLHLDKEIRQLEYEVKNMRVAQKILDEKFKKVEKFPLEKRQNEISKIILETEYLFGRNFSLYGDWIHEGNFGERADKIENNDLPEVKELRAKTQERKDFLSNYRKVDFSAVKKISTRQLAIKTGMYQEYDYIFSHTSRKIHAEPFSLGSEFASLSNHEKFIYVQYILHKLQDMLEVSHEAINKYLHLLER